MTAYERQKYDFETIVNFHKEVAQESMLNNMSAFVSAKFLIDMRSKKKVINKLFSSIIFSSIIFSVHMIHFGFYFQGKIFR